jgi:hypothetical protein
MIIGVYGFLLNVNKSSVNVFITIMNSRVAEASTCTMKYFNEVSFFHLAFFTHSLLLEPTNALLHFTTYSVFVIKMCKTFKIFRKKPLLHVLVGKRPSSGS